MRLEGDSRLSNLSGRGMKICREIECPVEGHCCRLGCSQAEHTGLPLPALHWEYDHE